MVKWKSFSKFKYMRVSARLDSQAIILVKFGEPVSTDGINGSKGIHVHILLLLEHVESLVVFGQARLETMLLSLTVLATAKVEATGAEFVAHCCVSVVCELAQG